jgi:uncharacterized phage protein (TIGR01671 family)
MRDIKFRAWDGRDMIAPYCVRGGKACIIRQCDTNDTVLTDDEGVHYYKNWDVEQPTEYPLMQFTGLPDINGVDIYEGDIVYVACYGHYTCEFPFAELYHAREDSLIGHILGNIHQNPELLQ